VVGATVVGATVVGATVVGATVVGATVVGATVVGATVVGTTVVGRSAPPSVVEALSSEPPPHATMPSIATPTNAAHRTMFRVMCQ
jgi:hypothetical protein